MPIIQTHNTNKFTLLALAQLHIFWNDQTLAEIHIAFKSENSSQWQSIIGFDKMKSPTLIAPPWHTSYALICKSQHDQKNVEHTFTTTTVTPLSTQKKVSDFLAYCSEILRITSADFSHGSPAK
jgi:23S rRNA A1618 N6-methylase RlmF